MNAKESMRMRRIALIGLILSAPLVASGCAYVGNPTEGFGGFIADTHTFYRGPNRPDGDAENMLRAKGEGDSVTAAALLPAEGNVWPGPIPRALTLNELENGQSSANRQPVTAPVGKSRN
jgi:hypothetical protein